MLQPFSLPAPVDGINLRKNAHELKPTEALQLDNYLCYDWGVREAGFLTSLTNPESSTPVGQMVFFKNASGTAYQLYAVNNKVYRSTLSGWGSPTNLTGALTITNDGWRPAFFKQRIFLANGTNVGLIYDISAATLANDTFTGLTTNNVSQWFSYKGRLYGIEKASSSVWYGPVDSISGALTEYDTGQFLESFGNLLFGTSWSLNPGNQNEQFLVLVTTDGEVLVYSGDYPSHPNWVLVTRVQTAPPLGSQAFLRFGQDVLIVTQRGVISLAQVVAGRVQEQYYNLSLNLGEAFGGVDAPPYRDRIKPFIYFPTSSGDIYVLNYERAAWSKITTGIASAITAVSVIDDAVAGSYPTLPTSPSAAASYPIICFANGSIRYIVNELASGLGSTWKTGFLPILPGQNKQAHKVRVRGRYVSGSGSFIQTAAVGFDTLAAGTSDTRSKAGLSSGDYAQVDLLLSGQGEKPCLTFAKTSAGEVTDIMGYTVFVTPQGGVE